LISERHGIEKPRAAEDSGCSRGGKTEERMKRALVILLNALLVLVIAAIILATWMPAIYTSGWFRAHFPNL
jgi:hypothetical protein